MVGLGPGEGPRRSKPGRQVGWPTRSGPGDDPQILDVRSPGERDLGHIAGSIHRYAPDPRHGLPDELDRSRDVWVVCASGSRALAAAVFLEAAGMGPIVVTSVGVPDVLQYLRRAAA